MDLTVDAPIVVRPGTNACFEHLVTAQAALTACISGQNPGVDMVFHRNGRQIRQTCFTGPYELEVHGDAALLPMQRHGWPSELVMHVWKGSEHQERYPQLTGMQRLMGSIYEHAFVAYFERVRDRIEARFGRIALWPDTIDFGRVVRNAFAHGGTVNISSGSREGSAWRGRSYTIADNGRQVLYNDISSGDLTVLMLEIDELL